MTAPIIRKASRKKARLRLGLSAPSGAGKTLGALLLAYGIIKSAHPRASNAEIWEKIGMIDTEEGSGELYVGVYKHSVAIGEYAYIRLSAPFTAVKYLEAQKAMEQAGIEIIIHDSLTHAWAGTGGLLEKQGRLTDADPKKNSYTAWRHVTPDHNALVDAMLQSPCHIIATMRSKVEYAMQNGPNGKQQVVKLGMAPIQREGMEYEFTAFFDIAATSIASATKDRTDLFSTVNASGFLEKREFMITPAIGGELYKWLDTGAEPEIIVTLESAAGTLAGKINAASTMPELLGIYQGSYQEFAARAAQENPQYAALMEGVFERKAQELNS